MKRKLLCLFILISSYSFAQKVENINLTGVWEVIKAENFEGEEMSLEDVVFRGRIKPPADQMPDDPRYAKIHFKFDPANYYVYRLGYGKKYDTKIVGNTIYKFGKPFYYVTKQLDDTLRVKESYTKVQLILKKVETELDDITIK